MSHQITGLELKLQRNRESNTNPDVSKTRIYSQFDEDNPKNRISVIGNPTVGKIKTIMVGVRNNSRSTKDIEVWLNELRLTGFNNQSGWAAQSALNVKLFGKRPGSTGGKGRVSNDLNLRADLSWRDQSALCRNIQDISAQATSGNKALKVSLSADYTFSRMLTLNAYFDHQTNIPVVLASSYPTSTNDFGVSLKFSLTR